MTETTIEAASFDPGGRRVSIGDTRLYIVERGRGYPLLILHGGPGMDHRAYGDYLDPLADEFRLIFVDQRGQGRSDPAPYETLTLAHMARDVDALARALELERYAVLGHSFGAFVTLQNALDFPNGASRLIVSSGVPSDRYLEAFGRNLARFQPADLRARVIDALERQTNARTLDELFVALRDGLPFFFGDPNDPRMDEFTRRTAGAALSLDVRRHFAQRGYGGIVLEDRLSEIRQPTLALAGRHDRACPVEASEAIARGIPSARLVVFERSGHMSYAEENGAFLAAVRELLRA